VFFDSSWLVLSQFFFGPVNLIDDPVFLFHILTLPYFLGYILVNLVYLCVDSVVQPFLYPMYPTASKNSAQFSLNLAVPTVVMSAESLAYLLNAGNSNLFDEIGDAVSKAVILMIKQQTVQDFFSNNTIFCSRCDQNIEPAEIQPDKSD